MPLEAFDRARQRGVDLDRVSDAVFKREVPSARDSYIIFDPLKVKVVQPKTQVICPTMDPEIDRGPEQPSGEPELEVGSLRM